MTKRWNFFVGCVAVVLFLGVLFVPLLFDDPEPEISVFVIEIPVDNIPTVEILLDNITPKGGESTFVFNLSGEIIDLDQDFLNTYLLSLIGEYQRCYYEYERVLIPYSGNMDSVIPEIIGYIEIDSLPRDEDWRFSFSPDCRSSEVSFASMRDAGFRIMLKLEVLEDEVISSTYMYLDVEGNVVYELNTLYDCSEDPDDPMT